MFVTFLPSTLLELILRHVAIVHRMQMRTVSQRFLKLISLQRPSLTIDVFYKGLGDLAINPHKLPIARKILPRSSICVNLKGRELHYHLESLDILTSASELVNVPMALLLRNSLMPAIVKSCSCYSVQLPYFHVSELLSLNSVDDSLLRYIYLTEISCRKTVPEETDTIENIYRLVSSNNPRYSRATVLIDMIKYVDDLNTPRLMKMLDSGRVVVVNMENAPLKLAQKVLNSWSRFHADTFTLKKAMSSKNLKLYVHSLTKRLPFSSLSISGDILPLLDRIPIRVSSSVFSRFESLFTPQILANIIHVEMDNCTLNDLSYPCLDCFIHIVEKCPHVRKVNWTLISNVEIHGHLYHDAEKRCTHDNIIMTYVSFPGQAVCPLNDVCPI
ncbi:hypothetical protein GEMRC1_011913 [Eukaryota sp. GEM-RC1]